MEYIYDVNQRTLVPLQQDDQKYIFPEFRRFTQFLPKLPSQTEFKTFEQVLEEQRLESLIQIIPRASSASSQPSQSGVLAYPEFFDYPYYEPHYAMKCTQDLYHLIY